ncbi:kinase-like protein, partial [Clavulina sp. PMI_390]
LLYQEAITHSQLEHPNILPFLGIYRENEESYPLMVLPYLERGSLEDRLGDPERGPITLSELTKLLIGTARGIAHLHSRKPPIIHGDLHPGNILIDKFDSPVLCDFGRSRIRHEVSRYLSERQEGGRGRFLAPELSNGQVEGFYSSQESDVFGLAMTYFNAWSGHLPFPKIRRELQVAIILNKGVRPDQPAQAVALDAPMKAEFWSLLIRMWAHEPVQRPSSSEVLEQLERIFARCKFSTFQASKFVTWCQTVLLGHEDGVLSIF